LPDHLFGQHGALHLVAAIDRAEHVSVQHAGGMIANATQEDFLSLRIPTEKEIPSSFWALPRQDWPDNC
jgi:hypothetical protein